MLQVQLTEWCPAVVHTRPTGQVRFKSPGARFYKSDVGRRGGDVPADAVLSNVNPGNTGTINVVFDIPKTAKLVRLELHDSAFSGGVEVRVA